jgi:hypothetical protein
LVLALSGRRIDPLETTHPAFPQDHVETVRIRLLRLFRDLGATTLVCSAACGADLLGLDVAQSLGIRSRVVLPYDPLCFRHTSVVDRPGDWGPIFDRVILAAVHNCDFINLQLPDTEASFLVTNEAVLEQAGVLSEASGERAAAVLVWEGVPKGESDFTERFGRSAGNRGMEVYSVHTL